MDLGNDGTGSLPFVGVVSAFKEDCRLASKV